MARVTAKLEEGPALERLREIARNRVVIGVLGADAAKSHGEGMTNVDVATIHEFGAPEAGIPERSFLRNTLTAQDAEIRKFVTSRARLVVSGKLDARTAYEQIGLKVRALVQARIRAGIPPMLKRRAGVPLIDTGQLIGSITPEVRSK